MSQNPQGNKQRDTLKPKRDSPSTGKSSNSSSSSNAAAGFWGSLSAADEVASETMALVVWPEPSAAADMAERGSDDVVGGVS